MKKLLFLAALLCSSVFALDIQAFSKTAFEQQLREADFTPVLWIASPSGSPDSFTIVSVTATNAATGANATGIVGSSPAPAIPVGTAHVVFMATGGVTGQTYRISVKIHDATTNENFEGVFVMTVIK